MHRSPTLLLFLAAAFGQFALAGNGGSGYSRYGLGDMRYYTIGSAMGMGGASLGVLSGSSLEFTNPAALSHITRARFSVGALYEGFSTSDDRKSTYLAGMQFNGFMFALPLVSKYGIVLGAGITPYSRVNYNVTIPTVQNGFTYDLAYSGDGGLSLGHIDLSLAPVDDLALGCTLQYYFGTMQHALTQTFAGTAYTNGGVDRTTRIDGAGVRFGAIYTGLKRLFNLSENQSLNVGAVLSTVSYLTMADERYYTYAASITTRDTSIGPDQKLRLPLSAGGGISFSSGQILVAADVYFQNWSEATFAGAKDTNLRSSLRFGLGGELTPKRASDAPFFQRLSYRAGVFYDETYYQVRGQALNEFGLTGGFGIPIFGDTRFNVGAEYSFRGTTDLQLQKDRILRISFTLSVGELWFVKPPEE